MHRPEGTAAVAVIVPVFNRLNLLRDTVDSLQAQTVADAEFILVDDRSNEQVRDYLASLEGRDSRFHVIRKPDEMERGAQSSRNAGLDAAKAESVVFLDSDDLLGPRCLEERLQFLASNPEADIVLGRQAMMWSPRTLNWVNVPRPGVGYLDRFLECAGEIDVPWINGGVLFRLERIRALGVRWRPEFHWDDLVFHIECLAAGMTAVAMSPDGPPDSYYLAHDEERYGSVLSTSSGIINAAEMFNWLNTLLRAKGQLTEERRQALDRSFFHFCIRQPVETGDRDLAYRLLRRAVANGSLSASNARRIKAYLATDALRAFSSRLSAYSLELARSTWLREFHPTRRATFATVPVVEG